VGAGTGATCIVGSGVFPKSAGAEGGQLIQVKPAPGVVSAPTRKLNAVTP
jgi:hypothetical protein